ncbi:MAG: hypothetical protein HWN66_19680 [Candidatus Helarchaeota archaeon]|nr:hypothetical protein [Candidatus Helarchaeota archaeon]
MEFYKGLVPHIEIIVTIGRTINLEKTARYGKLSQEYFENSAICIIHPNDMKRLGEKERNLKITTESGSVVVKAIISESETSAGNIVIPNGPWANKLIDEKTFQENQMWFSATIQTTKEKVPSIDIFLQELLERGS